MEEYSQYDDMGGVPQQQSSLKGYKIVIGLMAVVMIVMSALYYKQIQTLRGSSEELTVERDNLLADLDSLKVDFNNIRTENDTIRQQISTERFRADSLMEQLKKERGWSYAKVKKYEKELSTLKGVLKGYIRQIDSLNQLNTRLVSENAAMRRDITGLRLRADKAEESQQELQAQVRKASVVTVRDINLSALNGKDQEVKKARRATNLRVDFILNANPLAQLGERDVYVRVKGPNDMILGNANSGLFQYQGQKINFSAKRTVDYQGEDLPVAIYFGGESITEGRYNIELYMDGYMIGTNEIILQ